MRLVFVLGGLLFGCGGAVRGEPPEASQAPAPNETALAPEAELARAPGTSAPAAEPPAEDPVSLERKQLEAALVIIDPAARAQALGAVLENAGDPEVRRYAYRGLVQAYGRASSGGGAPMASVEARLLTPDLGAEDIAEKLDACYALAATNGLRTLAASCLASVPADLEDPALAAGRARLAGTLAFLDGDMPAAQQSLAAAAVLIGVERDAAMHLRLTRAQFAAGKTAPACASARALYGAHPLLPGARDALRACGNPARAAAALDAQARAALLASKRPSGLRVPVLALEDDQLRPVDFDPAATGRVTVLVFFSTWCPHCAAELPRVASFASALGPGRQVEVVGVRTAVEREREPYAEFARRHGVSFRVLTDATMSLAFSGFAKAAGIPPALPAVAVVDRAGDLRFVLSSGDWRDTARELEWAVAAVSE